MKRIIMMLTVALVMAAMMLAMAMPVLADTTGDQVGPGNQGPPATTGDFDHPRGSIVLHLDEGACVFHFGGGSSGGVTGGGCN
jgi:hypothetical protein